MGEIFNQNDKFCFLRLRESKTFGNCLCSSSCDSASLIQNIREFGAKNYFIDHQTANTIHSFRDSVLFLKKQGCY